LWFIYSRRCGVVCPTELGLLHFLKGMVFQVSACPEFYLLMSEEISSSQFLFWDPLHISVTNGARKLKFGTVVGIYAY